MAECEALAVSSTSTTTIAPTTTVVEKPEPRIKPMRAETKAGPPTPPAPSTKSSPPTPSLPVPSGNPDKYTKDKKDTPCKYFGKTYKGCARGSRCPFAHTWEGMEKERPSRCLECGGKHMVKDCVNKKGSSPTSAAHPKTPPPAKAPAPSSSSTTTTNKTVRIEETSEGNGGGNNGNEAAATGLKEVLADVGRMLKTMSATTLKKAFVKDGQLRQRICTFSAEHLNEEAEKEDVNHQGGLLDSGASNAMRTATEEEYGNGIPVRVTLAGEEERILRQNRQGTVLVPSSSGEGGTTQPIVPLGALISELGCSLRWKPEGLHLLHPQRGHIKVQIKNNCPEVSIKEANRLIKELEMNQVNKLSSQVATLTARLEVLRKEEVKRWDVLFKEYLESGCQGTMQRAIMTCPFTKNLPKDVQANLVTNFGVNGGEKYMKALPLSRRRRRLLLASRDWTVRLCMGAEEENDEFVKIVNRNGRVSLDVDVINSKMWDINGPSPIYKLLIWAAAKGKISDVLGRQPESTWTTSMHPTRGAQSWHQRTKDYPYGIPGLSVLQQHRLDKDLACAIKQLLIWTFASIKGQRNVGFLLEFPADVVPMREGEGDYLSFWKTEEWKAFRSVSAMRSSTFNQGAFGHQSQRPTTMATSYPTILAMDGEFGYGDHCVPPSLLSRATMRTWSREIMRIVAKAVVDYEPGKIIDEEEAVACGAKLSKLTKDEKEAWTQHLLNDHQPYRADCSVCLNAQATGYQHRRPRQPQLYALALDLAGPYKVAGRDMDFDDYKYIMVAAYKCPKEYLDAKSLEEVQKEFSMDEYEPSELEEDDLVEEVKESVDASSGGEEAKDGVAEGPGTLDEAVEELKEAPECITIYSRDRSGGERKLRFFELPRKYCYSSSRQAYMWRPFTRTEPESFLRWSTRSGLRTVDFGILVLLEGIRLETAQQSLG